MVHFLLATGVACAGLKVTKNAISKRKLNVNLQDRKRCAKQKNLSLTSSAHRRDTLCTHQTTSPAAAARTNANEIRELPGKVKNHQFQLTRLSLKTATLIKEKI